MTNESGRARARKVLLTSHHASRRGSAISLVELGRRLPEYGFEPIFVFSKPGPLADELVAEGYVVHQVKREGLLRLGLIRHVQKIIRRHGISLVHVNSAVAFSKYVAMAARLLGVPVVWHIREPVEDKRMRRQRRWVRWLASRIIVLTRYQALFFGLPRKVTRVFNGVDLARFRRQADVNAAKRTVGYSPDEFLFIQIGSIEQNKGQLRAVEALAEVLKTQPHCRLLIIGSVVEPAELQAINSLLESDQELKAAVRLYGETNDVRAFIWAADTLLLPSLRESFPRTVMEAMAGGLPVIASTVGAVEDMVQDGTTGSLVMPGDMPGLVGAMCKHAALEEQQLKIMRGSCERAAANLFSMESHVSIIARIYGEILSDRKVQEST